MFCIRSVYSGLFIVSFKQQQQQQQQQGQKNNEKNGQNDLLVSCFFDGFGLVVGGTDVKRMHLLWWGGWRRSCFFDGFGLVGLE